MGISTVRFTRDYRIYNSGDVAGFSDEEAKALIKGGVAVEAPTSEKPDKPERVDRKAAEK